MGVIDAVARFERDPLIEPTRSDSARANAEGAALGRPVPLDAAQRDVVRRALAVGASVSAMAGKFARSRVKQSYVRGPPCRGLTAPVKLNQMHGLRLPPVPRHLSQRARQARKALHDKH
jgi:hypothetical protein